VQCFKNETDLSQLRWTLLSDLIYDVSLWPPGMKNVDP